MPTTNREPLSDRGPGRSPGAASITQNPLLGTVGVFQDWGADKWILMFFFVVFGGLGPPAAPPGPPVMLFPPKSPRGLGQTDDPPILAPIRDISILMFFVLA